jgi:hypothetical protein
MYGKGYFSEFWCAGEIRKIFPEVSKKQGGLVRRAKWEIRNEFPILYLGRNKKKN